MKIPSKFAALVSAAVIVLNVFAPAVVQADSFRTAQQAVESINAGWNLGNTLDSYGTWISNVAPQAVETAWGNPVTSREMISSVKEKGFNAIRIPVTWAQFTDSDGNVDPAWMNRVHEIVDWAIGEDLMVILNVHHDTGEHGSDKVCWLIADTGNFESNQDKFAGLWTAIAEEFKDYDDRLMFEGYNEMLDMNNSWNASTTGTGAYDAVNSYAQLFVDTVRATGGNNLQRNLIVNTYVASVDQDVLSHFVLPEDSSSDHLICEVHAYTPYQFCSVDGDPSYTTFDDNCRNQIDNLMNTVDSFSASLGVPVIIGEFGVEDQNNDSDRVSYTEYYISRATERGIKCFWWDNGAFGSRGYAILDRNSLTWNDSIVNAILENAGSVSRQTVSEDTESAEPEETAESTEPASGTWETEISVTEVSVGALEETAEGTFPETAAEESEASQNINGKNVNVILILVVGVIVVASCYAGLFALGRRNGRKGK